MPDQEIIQNNPKVLKGWTEDSIGELPIIGDRTIMPNEDLPEAQTVYMNMQILKNIWVRRPSEEMISDTELKALQKKVEVSSLAIICRLLGYEVEAPVRLNQLVRIAQDLYPNEKLKPLQSAQRMFNQGAISYGLLEAQSRIAIRRQEREDEDKEVELEDKIIEGKKVFFLTGLMAKGISYGFIHFCTIFNDLLSKGQINKTDVEKLFNENFGFASALLVGEKRIDQNMTAEISDHVMERIIDTIRNTSEDSEELIILISDDVIDQGLSAKAVIRRIKANLEQAGLSPAQVSLGLRSIVVDIASCYMSSCVETDNRYLWKLRDHKYSGHGYYEIEISK